MKSRKSRQEILQNRFYFDCICKFCQEEPGYYNNDLKVYKEFGNLVEKLEEFKPVYEINMRKRRLITLKEMYELGKTKNLGEFQSMISDLVLNYRLFHLLTQNLF